jgi:glycosyltransferase involved in cell wall biosynthesis
MISVCIPTHNGEKFIYNQLKSILIQLSIDDEIIISDDSSTDKTMEIVNSFNDPRIRIFEHGTFQSPIYNLENALKHAKGEYIFLSDQDDIWMQEKVLTMTQYLMEYDLVVSDCKIVDANNSVIQESFFNIVQAHSGFIHNWIRNGFLGCCMAFRSNVLKFVLPFPRSIAMHDIWIGLMTEALGSTYFLKERLILYRRHETNASLYTGGASKFTLLYRLKYRLVMLACIIKRVISFKHKLCFSPKFPL